MREEFLRTLGLDPGLQYPPAVVKKAWRDQCNKHHPDKGGDAQEFIKVTHAYKMLTDPSYRHEQERKHNPEVPDLNLQMQIPVTFEEAFFGREISVSYNRLEIGQDFQPIKKEEQELVYIHFTLPRGCFEGHQLKKDGFGHKQGDRVGDTFIRVIPMGHPRFKPKGHDIMTQEKVPLDLMLRGGELEVQTMYGLRTLKIPPGTQPGAHLKIRKCGVGNFGDHVVVVDPIFPDKNTLKTDEAWKGLDINWEDTEESEDIKLEQVFINIGGNIDINELFRRRGR